MSQKAKDLPKDFPNDFPDQVDLALVMASGWKMAVVTSESQYVHLDRYISIVYLGLQGLRLEIARLEGIRQAKGN